MPDETDIDRAEKDRKRRERELLLFLLLLGWRCRREVLNAIRLDTDPLNALALVWLGSPHFVGAVKPIANAMADAHAAGYRRVGRMIGETASDVGGRLGTAPAGTPESDIGGRLRPAAGAVDTLPGIYRPAAQNAATLAYETMQHRLLASLSTAVAPDARIDAAKQAFVDGGWDKSNPRTLTTVAETVIVQAYGAGMFAAGMDSPNVKGFRHRSILDTGTTRICSQRDGLTLPKNDLYWLRGFAPLHFGCRSLLVPVMSIGPWSTWLPTEPPAPGFGYPPIGFSNGIGVAA